MTTHLSARLVWHDRGWDGHICDHPEQNSFCVVQQHIRESLANPKNLQREVDHHATPLAELEDWQPPCSHDPIAFSSIGYTIMHKGCFDFRKLPFQPNGSIKSPKNEDLTCKHKLEGDE
jgi:exodeoxyribonuclease V alpha subunit